MAGEQKAEIASLLQQRDEAVGAEIGPGEREERAREAALMQQDRSTLIAQRDEKMKEWGLAELALKQEIEAITRAAEVSRQEHAAALAQHEKVAGEQKAEIASLLQQRDEAGAKLDREREERAREFTSIQQDRSMLIAQRDEKMKEWGWRLWR